MRLVALYKCYAFAFDGGNFQQFVTATLKKSRLSNGDGEFSLAAGAVENVVTRNPAV